MIKLTNQEESEIVRLYKEGLTIKKIVEQQKIYRRKIRLILHKHGVEVKGIGTLTKKNIDKEQVKFLMQEGGKQKEIASKLGCSPSVHNKYIKINAIEKPAGQQRKPITS